MESACGAKKGRRCESAAARRAGRVDFLVREAARRAAERARAAIRASLERYASDGLRLRKRLAGLDPRDGRPLSQVLQDALYDERGLPR